MQVLRNSADRCSVCARRVDSKVSPSVSQSDAVLVPRTTGSMSPEAWTEWEGGRQKERRRRRRKFYSRQKAVNEVDARREKQAGEDKHLKTH